MPILYQQDITVADIRANPSVLYVYSDSDIRQVNEITSHENAVGLRIQKNFSIEDCHWDDTYYRRNVQHFRQDWKQVEDHLFHGGIVVIPLRFGEYMAEECPQTDKNIKDFMYEAAGRANYHEKPVV